MYCESAILDLAQSAFSAACDHHRRPMLVMNIFTSARFVHRRHHLTGDQTIAIQGGLLGDRVSAVFDRMSGCASGDRQCGPL